MSEASSTELVKMAPDKLAELDELTQVDRMIAVGINQLSVQNGKLPEPEQLAEFLGLTVGDIQASFAKPSVQALTANMGVPMQFDRDTPNHRKVLTPIQVMVANAVLNHMDKRTVRQKLKEFEIKPSTWQGWMTHNKAFIDYINKKAGDDFAKLDYLTNVKITELIEDGDLAAIKLAKELSGQLTNKVQIDLNINLFLVKLVEVIQTHVSNPDERDAIATAVEALAIEFVPKGMK